MRRLLLLVALAVAPAAACGSHETSSAAVTPGAPAGDVTELAGEVHAVRAGATRTLARGDVVSGDDVITTGADGRVTIVLRRNHVPWSLGPSKTKQVSDSAAWSATAAAGTADVGDDHSAAAGRHAERSATDTTATAVAPPVQPVPTTGSGSAAGSAGSAGSDAIVGALGGSDGEALGGLGLKGTGGGGGAGGGETIGLGQIGTIGHGAGGGAGQGYGAGHGRLGGGHASAAPKITISATTRGELPKEIATRIARRSLGRFRLCYENQLLLDPSAAGRVVITFVVDTAGAVPTSNVQSTTIADDVASCVARGVMALSFPSGTAMTVVTLKLTFAPAD